MKKVKTHLSDGAAFSPWAVCQIKAYTWNVKLTLRWSKITCKRYKKMRG